jgi:oligo-alginate lyase
MNGATPLLGFDTAQRRALAARSADANAAPFAVLADSLERDLEPLIHAALPIPSQKARLTRIGGRCPIHGVLLEFDPWQPRAHRCVRCNRHYDGREHDDWWAMGAQLWTAERAVHAAALFLLRGDTRHAHLAARILRAYTERYESWPNADNVLGPTRPFFSTYLESIWLLNLCHATALLESAGASAGAAAGSHWTSPDASALRAHVLEPSAALIDGYHEGRSNRQVWNEVAVCSAWRLLGRARAVHERLTGSTGLLNLLATGLDADGFWYEGENYHLFAHRGLWYGVELMRAVGLAIPPDFDARYAAGFVAPFLGVLPDGTFPSRRDSQYASSIRQWRTAEWCELGWTHSHDPRLAGVLSTLYDGHAPPRDTGRACSTADAERNTPPARLTRANLSWRALLMASPVVPTGHPAAPISICLPAQGLAVLRRNAGRTYVALEGGLSGGGHGHPDLLALTLQTGEARWLQDPGTGSYVEERLAWYRSSWSHHAPFVDGRSQAPATAEVTAFDEQDGLGWMVKCVDGLAPGVTMERTVVVAEDYLIDVLEWESAEEHDVSLPIAAEADVIGVDASDWRPYDTGSLNDEPGYRFVQQPESVTANGVTRLRAYASAAYASAAYASAAYASAAHASATDAPGGTAALTPPAPDASASQAAQLWYVANAPSRLARATVPGPPGQGDTRRHWLEARAARGRFIGVWSWPTEAHPDGAVSEVIMPRREALSIRVRRRDGQRVHHERTGDGWRAETQTASHLRVTALERRGRPLPPPSTGHRTRTAPEPRWRIPHVAADAWAAPPGSAIAGAFSADLGESHYVQTERPWHAAGAPTARVQLAVSGEWLIADVDVTKGDPLVVVADEPNPLDNEPRDVNADGLQWYMNPVGAHEQPDPKWAGAGLIVPAGDAHESPVGRHTVLAGPGQQPQARWCPTARGWAMRVRWSLRTVPTDARGALAFDLVVNERPPERERRRGQLVLSGGGGFGYLAGPRRPVERFVILSLVPPHGEPTFR